MHRKKIRILFFIESMSSGGKERRLIELLKGLSSFNFIDFEIILSNENIHYNDINNYKLNIINKNNLSLSIYKLNKLIKKYKPHIIHCFGHVEMLQILICAMFSNYKIINSTISTSPDKVSYFSKLNLINKLVFPFSDIILSNSKSGIKSYGLEPSNRVFHIYNGFDLGRNKNLDSIKNIKKKFNINTELIVGMVASFSDKKDYKTYIDAATKVIDDGCNITFLCIGSGDDSIYKNSLNNRFRENIKFLGRQEDVESIMNICDIGVLSTYTEGISNSLMEFMALGKPVIATDGGGTSELVKNNKTGLLVKVRNVQDLYEKIIYLINNPDIGISMGKKGLSRIEKVFSLDQMIDKTVRVYKELVKN
jgi:glycosyltransferase involved in cell wall biosynthesis